MSALFVGLNHVKEHKVGVRFVYKLKRSVGEIIVCIVKSQSVDVLCLSARTRTCYVTDWLPAIEKCILLLCFAQLLKKSVEGANHGHISIRGNSVSFRGNTVKQRHMARQRYGRQHCFSIQCIIGIAHHLLDIGVSAGKETIGTHTVYRDQNHFVLNHPEFSLSM